MLRDKLNQDLKDAMIARDEAKVSALRMFISAVRYSQSGRDEDISDEDVIKVAQKEIKKREEAAAGFRQGGREDQAKKEEYEADIIKSYLPPQMSDEELGQIVDEAINSVGAKTMADMGKVMGVVMPKVGSSASSSRVSLMVKDKIIGANNG